MKIEKTKFKDLLILNHKIINDHRGRFNIIFNNKILEKFLDDKLIFCQDNSVFSKKYVLRGLHFQKNPYEQAKIVSVFKGKILDVAVDLRKDSLTYGKYFTIILSEKSNKSLFIPRGFAHGYLSLSDEVLVNYKVDNIYNVDYERGIKFNDTKLNIDWKMDSSKFILSEKDMNFQDYQW